MKCPSCGLINPPEATCCDCGFNFVKGYADIKNVSIGKAEDGIVIKDIKMPFWSMVVFMVKWVVASIPALIILTLIAFFVFILLAGLGVSITEMTGASR